jgi:predicted RNase H-like HicB family nuclease
VIRLECRPPEDGRGEAPEAAMKYSVLLEESDEGFAVSVPGLPGCHSQGATRDEALANIKDAIREYLAVVQELTDATTGAQRAEVEV